MAALYQVFRIKPNTLSDLTVTAIGMVETYNLTLSDFDVVEDYLRWRLDTDYDVIESISISSTGYKSASYTIDPQADYVDITLEEAPIPANPVIREISIGGVVYDIDAKNAVHKTGEETIQSTKIITDGHLKLRSNSFSATEKTSTSTQMSQQFIRLSDIDDRVAGELSIKRTGNTGDTKCCLYAHNTTDGNDSWSELAIHSTDNGEQFATCPTPSISSNDVKIATTAWCRTTGNGLVHTEGNETINGTKTFTSNINGTATSALWADLAEYYEADQAYEPGTLLQVGGEKEITIATTEVNLIVSTKPGFILNRNHDNSENWLLCCLSGRLPVLVDGSVKKGDRLYLSKEQPGKASTTVNGNAIAIALENGDKLVNAISKLTF